MKIRQITLRQSGDTAHTAAMTAADTLKSKGYAAESGRIPSPAGSFADTVYLMTDAPIAKVWHAIVQAGGHK